MELTYHESSAANAFAALGHEARLSVFRLLVRAGENGMIIRDIQKHLSLPPSTLSHHVKTLVGAGLVVQERQGSHVFNKPNFDVLTSTLRFLVEECCVGVELQIKAA
jgi:DNA-binding transcriptional ArsR family regulator